MEQQESQSQLVSFPVQLLVSFLLGSLLVGGGIFFWQQSFSMKNKWVEHPVSCAAIADILRIYIPQGWEVSGPMPIYDGPYNPNPTTQEEIDFNTYASQCQIHLGFREKPTGYQVFNPNNLAHIVLKADRTKSINNLDQLKSDNSIDNSERIKINEQEYLVENKYFENYIHYKTIINKTAVTMSLHVKNPGKNPKLDSYFQETFQDFVEKLSCKKKNKSQF